jgi:hypothetical protein
MSWCSDAPEDEAISLFAGLLANPDVRLSHTRFRMSAEVLSDKELLHEYFSDCFTVKNFYLQQDGQEK